MSSLQLLPIVQSSTTITDRVPINNDDSYRYVSQQIERVVKLFLVFLLNAYEVSDKAHDVESNIRDFCSYSKNEIEDAIMEIIDLIINHEMKLPLYREGYEELHVQFERLLNDENFVNSIRYIFQLYKDDYDKNNSSWFCCAPNKVTVEHQIRGRFMLLVRQLVENIVQSNQADIRIRISRITLQTSNKNQSRLRQEEQQKEQKEVGEYFDKLLQYDGKGSPPSILPNTEKNIRRNAEDSGDWFNELINQLPRPTDSF